MSDLPLSRPDAPPAPLGTLAAPSGAAQPSKACLSQTCRSQARRSLLSSIPSRYWISLPLAPIVFSLATGCYPSTVTDQRGRDNRPAPAVEVVSARVGSLPLQERVSGVVKAQNQVAIHPEISSSVAEVLVRSGEAVTQGQPLVRLDDAALKEQLRQAEAAVSLAEAAANESRARLAELDAQVTRTRALAEQSLVSDLELETREAQLEAAKAAAAQAVARVEQARATADERRSALGKSVIRAPVSGRVGQRNAEVGMIADRGTVLFVLGNLDHVRVEVPLTEEMLGHVHEGQAVRLSAATLGEQPREAKLSRISPFLAEGSFSTVGEIDVDNRDGALRPGMFVAVDVLYGESKSATLVPSSALWEDPQTGLLGVYVVRGFDSGGVTPASKEISKETHAVEFRSVQVLAEGRSSVGVQGLDEGEWVVTVGQHMLQREHSEAYVRETTWERVLELQGLQREDMLHEFLEQQQILARQRGNAEVPPLGELTASTSVPGTTPATANPAKL